MKLIVYSYVKLFSEALESCILERERSWQVSTCQSGRALKDSMGNVLPNVVLVDITVKQALVDISVVSGLHLNTTFVALSVPESTADVIACADAGFSSYIPRSASITELIDDVKRALRGECASSPTIVGGLLQEVSRRRHAIERTSKVRVRPLTFREVEIIDLVRLGYPNKEIAHKLNLSVSTIKNHVCRIFGKLDVSNRASAIARINENPALLS